MKRKRFEIKVLFDDGDYLYTSINAYTESEVRDYYIGTRFNNSYESADGWIESSHIATAVEFL